MPYADPEAQREYNRRKYRENRVAVLAKVAAWQRENPDRTRANRARWRERNPEYAADWYQQNRERVLARVRERYEERLVEEPDHVRRLNRETAARRRARLRESVVEKVDVQAVWDRDQGRCGICGTAADPTNWHLDHITPVSKGGEHSYANVRVTHAACNWQKADK